MQRRWQVLLCLVFVCAGVAQAGMLKTDPGELMAIQAVDGWLFPHGAVLFDGVAFEVPAGEENLWFGDRSGRSGRRDSNQFEDAPELARLATMLGHRWDAGHAVSAIFSAFGEGSGRGQWRSGRDDDSDRRRVEFRFVPAQNRFDDVIDGRQNRTVRAVNGGQQLGEGVTTADMNTPEPSTLALIALGFALLGVRRLRRA